MYIINIDIDNYALELRRIAASYQTGDTLSSVKKKVDELMDALKASLAHDSHLQVEKWSELAQALNLCMRNTADPNWTTVMAYARRKVNRSKQNALFKRRRFKE
ncbi:hypothetical protein [Pantoea sp. KPR_PJ]|uniref:hypothetical protein n=1 Tax=Pantoea sp. KPR_PJ TaxID=2738375 RepID=UPI0035286546